MKSSGKPLSDLSEALLHTNYEARNDLQEDPSRYEAMYQADAPVQEPVKEQAADVRYRCTICGYIYEGDITKESDDYKCPICTVPKDMFDADIKGKFDYTHKDTFMGFHCGNTCSSKLAACSMKYQKIMARSLPVEVTNGTLEGDIAPGDITFFRLQSTSDAKLRGYIANGEVLPVATRSFGSIGVFAIPEMGRFYRHVLIEKNYPHHGAVAFGHHAKALYEVFKYVGVPVEEIGYNQPKGVRYPTENPWG